MKVKHYVHLKTIGACTVQLFGKPSEAVHTYGLNYRRPTFTVFHKDENLIYSRVDLSDGGVQKWDGILVTGHKFLQNKNSFSDILTSEYQDTFIWVTALCSTVSDQECRQRDLEKTANTAYSTDTKYR